jgi:hypothetical protein
LIISRVILFLLILNRSKILPFLIGLKPLIIPTDIPATTTTCKPVIESAQVTLNPPSLQVARIDSIESLSEDHLEDEQYRIMRQMIKQQDEAIQSFQREKLRKRAATPTPSARR